MANPIQTNGTHNRAEEYASAIVKLMRPALKLRNTFARDYEGDARTGAIKIPVRTLDPTIREYDVKNGLAPSQSATTYIDAVVNKTYAINELIDGFEAQAVPDNLVAQRLEAGAYAISKQLEDEAIATLLTGTVSENTTASTESTIYANIVKEIAKLSKKGVDKNRMYVAISYDTEVMLLTDSKYSNTASQIGAELAREGVVGRINGVNVITEDLGEGVEFVVYGADWVQTADVFKSNPRVVDLNGSSNYVDASALKARFGALTLLTNTEAVIVKKNTLSA